MLSAEVSFWVLLVASLVGACFAGWRWGKEVSLGVGMACSLLAASWFEINFAGLPLSVPSATAAVLLIALVIHSPNRVWSPLTVIDLLVIALVVWHIVVDVHHGGRLVSAAIASYGEWALPYTAGRYGFLFRGSLTKLSPWFAGIAAIVALGAIVESLTSVNLWETVLAEKDTKVKFLETIRYELAQRAHGSTRHAIFFGIILLSMIPWPVALFDSIGSENWHRILSTGLLLVIVFGVVATLSRGPVMALVLVGVLALSYQYPVVRWSGLIAFLFGAFVLFAFPDQVIGIFDSQPNRETQSTVIQLDEDSEAQIYSGTRNRLFVVQIYGPLVLKSGLFGYGTVASEGFPPANLPGLPTDPVVLRSIGIVDNSFINIGLRFGLIGMVLFLLILLAAAATAFLLAGDASTYFFPHSGITFAVLGSVVLALGCEILTVYFDHDHGFWVLCLLGAISGLQGSTQLDWSISDDN